MKQEHNKNHLLFFIVIALMLEAILFFVGNFKLNTAYQNEENNFIKIQNTLAGIPFQARAVSVYDVTSNREIYGKNQNESLPLASLVKTMTVLVALSENEPNSVVTISQNAIRQSGNYGFLSDEKLKIEDLAKFTLVGSSNDGAFALSGDSEDFLEKMNIKSKKIGMENALFLNTTGLDIDGIKVGLPAQAGAYASALDANMMAVFALKARTDIFSATVLPEINLKSESGLNHYIRNTDLVLHKIPNLLFSKTGYTTLAGGNLTIVFRNEKGHDIAVTVLGSTINGRFLDMENLVNVLY